MSTARYMASGILYICGAVAFVGGLGYTANYLETGKTSPREQIIELRKANETYRLIEQKK